MMRKKLMALGVILGFLLPLPLHATTNRFSLIDLKFGMSDGDLVVTLGSNNLKKFDWEIYTQVDYMHRPLELISSGIRVGSVVDRLFIQHFGTAFAITSWWQIEADMPLIWLNSFAPPTIPLAHLSNQFNIGDVSLRNRVTLLRRDNSPIGLTLNPFVTLPTGNENHFVGNSQVTGGGVLGLDANLGRKLFVGLNAGAEFREPISFFDFNTASRLLLSGGIGFQPTKQWTFKADVSTATPLKNLFKIKDSSPTEALFAVSYQFSNSGFQAHIGGGASVVRAVGVPLLHIIGGLSYTGRSHYLPQKIEPLIPEALPEPEDRSLYRIFFEKGSAQLSQESLEILDKALKTLSENPKLVIVSGHTDNKGSHEINVKLSLKRAEKVVDYLSSHGIEKSKITLEHFGEKIPLEENTTEDGRMMNRRVEIKILN